MRSVLPIALALNSLAVLCVSDPDCHTAEWHKSEKATFVFGLNNQVFFYDIFSSQATINEQRLIDAAQEAINTMGIDVSTPSVQLLSDNRVLVVIDNPFQNFSTAYLHKYRGGSYVFDYTEEPSVTLPSVHRCHTLVNDTLICPPDCIQLEMDGPDRVRVKRSFQDKDKCERAIDNIEEKYNPCAGKRERDAPNADYVAMPRNLGYYEFDDWAFFRDENHDLRFWWNCVDKKCANKCKFGHYGHTNFQIYGLLHPYKCESEKWNGKQLVDYFEWKPLEPKPAEKGVGSSMESRGFWLFVSFAFLCLGH